MRPRERYLLQGSNLGVAQDFGESTLALSCFVLSHRQKLDLKRFCHHVDQIALEIAVKEVSAFDPLLRQDGACSKKVPGQA